MMKEMEENPEENSFFDRSIDQPPLVVAAGAGGGGGPPSGPERPRPPEFPEWWNFLPDRLKKAEWEHWSWVEFDPKINPDSGIMKPLVTMLAIDATLSSRDDLTETERNQAVDSFNNAVEEWKGAASLNKVYQVGIEVAKKEKELEKYDRAEIKRVENPEAQEELTAYIYGLDELEFNYGELYPDLFDDRGNGKPKLALYTDSEWDQRKKDLVDLDQKIKTFRGQISTRTSSQFLVNRDKLKSEVKQAKDKEKNVKEEEEKNQNLEHELEGLEDAFGKIINKEVKPALKQFSADSPSFFELKEFLEEQEALRDSGDVNFYREGYERAKAEGLAHYFAEARDLGLFEEIEKGLEVDFQTLVNDVIKSGGNLTRDVLDKLTLYPQQYAKIAERPEAWQFHERRGVSPEEIKKFKAPKEENGKEEGKGLRGIFIKRAYGQMYEALFYLSQSTKLPGEMIKLQELFGQAREEVREYGSISPTTNDEIEELRNKNVKLEAEINEHKKKRVVGEGRVNGEWDVRPIEQGILEQLEKQNKVRVIERLFVESVYQIELRHRRTGQELQSKGEIQTAVDQFVYEVLYGTGAYDLQRIIGRMENMKIAIGQMTEIIQDSEGVTQEKATEILNQIRWSAENQIWIHIRNYSQERLMMEQDASAGKEWIKEDKRVAALLTQQDGLGGLEMYQLLDPRANLFFSPVGFRGQFLNDKVSQYYLRETIKKLHIQKLMNYEFNSEENDLQDLTKCKSFDEFRSKFKERGSVKSNLNDAERVARDNQDYGKNILNQWKWNPQSISKEELMIVLEGLKRTRENLGSAKAAYESVRQRAKAAFEFAVKTYDVLGVSAELGDTTEIMANGDHIKTEHFVMALKYAIIEAGKSKEFKEAYHCEDNLALMRKRGNQWVEEKGEKEVRYRMWAEELDEGELKTLKVTGSKEEKELAEEMLDWLGMVKKEAGKHFDAFMNTKRENLKTISQVSVVINKKDSSSGVGINVPVLFNLQPGLEDSGITKKQWEAVEQTYRDLQIDGSNAKIGGKYLREITQRKVLKAVSNTFLFAYAGTRDNVNNAQLIREAMRGKKPWLRNVREKLALTGREEFMGDNNVDSNDEEEVLDIYTEAISDNISFDIDVRKIANFLSTREKVVSKDGNRITDVSIKKVIPGENSSTVRNTYHTTKYEDYGFPGQNWLSKRIRHFKRYYDKNKRATVGRFIEFNNNFPINNHGSVPRETEAEDVFDWIWNRDMDQFDEYTLTTEIDRELNLWAFNHAYVGGFNMQTGKKDHGFSDKPGSDMDRSGEIPGIKYPLSQEVAYLMGANVTPQINDFLNRYVQNLIDRDENYLPLHTLVVKRFDADSAAAGSGLGYEQGEKFNYRYLKTMYSRGKQGQGGRLSHGLVIYSNVAQFYAWSIMSGSFGKDVSLIGRKGTKERGSRNPRIPSTPVVAKAG